MSMNALYRVYNKTSEKLKRQPICVFCPHFKCFFRSKTTLKMTRGNQRDLARAKNQKKQEQIAKKKGTGEKGANAGKTLEDRRHRDAEAMRLKQKKAEEKRASEGATGGKK